VVAKLRQLHEGTYKSETLILIELIEAAHVAKFPPRKVGAVEARRQAEKDNKVVMRAGDERWSRYGDRAYCIHVDLDGNVAWGPFRHPAPDDASRKPVTALALATWRAANQDPPWDAREIRTAYNMDLGTVEASDPADQAEFELRMRQKAGEA
jgi:hypothetical protein